MNHEPLSSTCCQRPFPSATSSVSRGPVWIVDVDAERQLRSPIGAFDLQERRAVRAFLLMRVVEQQRATQRVAVVENDGAARVLELGHRRVGNRTAVHSAGLPNQRAYGVEVMNRVIENLEPLGALQKFPEVPRLLYDEPHFDVDNLTELAAGDEIAERQHVRAEAELEIHRRDRPRSRQILDDRPGRGQVFSHRLLNEHRRSSRQLFQHAGNLIAGNGDVKDRVRAAGCLGERGEARSKRRSASRFHARPRC